MSSSCITKTLLEEALRNFYRNPYMVINNFTLKNAVPNEENYLSDIFRISINFTDNRSGNNDDISIMAKCGNKGGAAKQTIAIEMKLFEKESKMYCETLPALHRLLGQDRTLTARCLYANTNPHYIILLEDLSKLGYKVLSRNEGIDLNHCLKVMERIAELHAASAALFQENPSLACDFNEGMFVTKVREMNEWMKSGVTGLADACSTWRGYEKYSRKMYALGNEIVNRGLKAAERPLGGFNVLNHGDLTVNNILFLRNEDGSCRDLRFVDFQMSVYTSPAVDLHLFMSTSLNSENLTYGSIKEMLDHYYDHLLLNLSRLNRSLENVPSKEEFKKDLKNRASYGFLAMITALPLVRASRRTDATLENLISDPHPDGFRKHAYNNDAYRKYVEFLLPYYDNLGVLD